MKWLRMDKYYRRMKPTLGTFVEIGLEKSDFDFEEVATNTLNVIDDFSRRLNFHSPDSELSLLNDARGNFVKLSRQCVNVIRLAKQMGKASNEKFNCTIGNRLDSSILDSEEYGTSEDIIISGSQVKLNPNVKIVLDGIAKGFAVDLAIRSLKNSGVRSGWVNAGGDLRVFGDLEWPIYIKDPNSLTKALIKIKNAAVATSYTANEKDIERYSADFSQRGGVKSKIGLISIVSKSTWRADALTKVAANLDEAERKDKLKLLGGELVELYEGYLP